MRLITKLDKEYPKKLLEIKESPEKIYVEGDYTLLNKNSIAIVGSRKCTPYGWRQAKKIANELSKKDICVISGMAIGIDTAAHIGAKSEKGKTIAVLGSGLENVYPIENIKLYQEILEDGGCVISEYEPREKVDMSKFPTRNRIISGISMGVVLIEAKYRSGSNITARQAIKQNKPVFCLPSNVESTNGYGTNKLIQQGANLIMNAQDILQEYEMLEDICETEVEEQYQEIYKTIGNVPISANEICKMVNKQISEVNEALFMLELQGTIKAVAGNQFVREIS